MKMKQYTKFSLFYYKEIAQQTVATAIILAFALAICVVPSIAKTKSTKKRNNSANRSVKSSPQSKTGLNDPKLDTITVTNQNVGNFKKGFIGDNKLT